MTDLSEFREHILKLDHTALAVHSIREASKLYGEILGGVFLFGHDQRKEGFRFEQYRYPNGGENRAVGAAERRRLRGQVSA